MCLLLAAAFLFQGARGVFETTEGRYSNVASEMIRLEDWIVPHLDEEKPHFTKPPLTYWLLAASIETFGRNELALRLPGAIAFFLTVLFVARAGRMLVPSYPLLPAVIYSSFLFPATVSNVVSTDSLLTLTEVGAMTAFAEHYFGTRQHWLPPAISGWFLFGLAFLTKGYPALLPMIALAIFHYLRGRHASGKKLLIAPGLVIFFGVAASWFGIVVWRDPTLLQYFIGDELLGRVAGQHNRNPEWYKAITVYGPVLLLGTIPWTLQATRAFGEAVRTLFKSERRDSDLERAGSDVILYPFLWLVVPTAVFLLAKSRLELYLLPQFAPLAILTALSLSPKNGAKRSIGLRACLGVALVLAVRLAAAAMDSDNDSRRVARQIKALPDAVATELVFVDVAPYRGIAFYLGAEVEQVALSQDLAKTLGIETVHEEMHNGESDRIWLVPIPLVNQFQSIAKADNLWEVSSLGEISTDQPLMVFILQ
jgi:4-amino-4-deoxy-L-arabinose transferase